MKVSEFRKETDLLMDCVNVHRHSCVGSDERELWLVNAEKRLARVSSMVCSRANSFDVEQHANAVSHAKSIIDTFNPFRG